MVRRMYAPQRRWLNLAALSLCAAVMSCNSIVDSLATDLPVPNEVDQPPLVREAVVPALLGAVDANGRLRFPVPNVGADEMPLDTALVQAREFQFYGLNLFLVRGTAEGQRGAFIDFPTLVQCNRPQLARSVFEAPPDSLAAALKVELGNRWLIPFCGERLTPEIIVSVATLGNRLRYKNGRPSGPPGDSLRGYSVRGIPWEWRAEHMVTAEEAVNEAYVVTGVRVAALPEIAGAEQINFRSVGNYGVVCPVWRVTFERSVRVAAVYSLRRLDVAQVYVADSQCPGVLGRAILLTPWTEQPVTRRISVQVQDSLDETIKVTLSYDATYRSPVNFESVVIEK